MKSDLEGKIILVTGAAQGIGLAIADRLSAQGATVVYTDVNADRLRATMASRSGRPSGLLDVTAGARVGEVLDAIHRDWGRLDVLVNNAGVNTLQHRVDIDAFPREEWDRLIGVDLTGVYETSRKAAALMKRQGEGRIINITSVFGLVPARLQCAFVAAKAGVVNLTRAMALELGPHGILVNGVAPGSTLTEGTEKLFYGPDGKFNSRVQEMLDHVPLGRPATTEEIAVAVQFLADPENTYMNGHILTVDGGWTAGYHRQF